MFSGEEVRGMGRRGRMKGEEKRREEKSSVDKGKYCRGVLNLKWGRVERENEKDSPMLFFITIPSLCNNDKKVEAEIFEENITLNFIQAL